MNRVSGSSQFFSAMLIKSSEAFSSAASFCSVSSWIFSLVASDAYSTESTHSEAGRFLLASTCLDPWFQTRFLRMRITKSPVWIGSPLLVREERSSSDGRCQGRDSRKSLGKNMAEQTEISSQVQRFQEFRCTIRMYGVEILTELKVMLLCLTNI